MSLIATVVSLKGAIDRSVSRKSRAPWRTAVENTGMALRKRSTGSLIEEVHELRIGDIALRLIHSRREMSGPPQNLPARTTLVLELYRGESRIDSYSNGYDH